jgi:hypothetical protein
VTDFGLHLIETEIRYLLKEDLVKADKNRAEG